MPYSGSMVILSNVGKFRKEKLQQRPCQAKTGIGQANVHGKPGQLKCFQKRQNKCKCHVTVRLEWQIC